MNEKYLWDKTGEDAEIEKLENALHSFRYRETAPPVPPAKIIPFEPKQPRKFFRFAFAFAACAVLFAAGLGIWLNVPGSNTAIETAQIDSPQISAPISKPPRTIELHDSTVVNTIVPNLKKIAAPKYAVERKIIKSPKITGAKISTNETLARNIRPKSGEMKLTQEEKYAYDQLMLALSITSEKLKIVKDKSEGLE